MNVMNMYECCWFPLCMMINCICACFSSKSLFKHVVSAILCMHMFMGLLARVVNAMVASSSPVGRDGDVTVSGIRAHVTSMGLNEP